LEVPVDKFELDNTVHMVFGSGEFERLGKLASPHGKKPLLVIGRSHAKTTGLLDMAVEYLHDAGIDPVIFEGIEPNPRLGTVTAAAKKAIEEKCDMVIGLGGGSVMDAAKAIAFGFYDPDNIWKHIAKWEDGYSSPEKALPIVLVSTLAATGSEGNMGGVVTNENTREKYPFGAPCLYPKVSIIDPELAMSVPMEYTSDGAIDMCVHVVEGYFNGDPSATFSDRMTESFILEVRIAMEAIREDPADADARYQLSYLGAVALTGFINRPRGGYFPIHSLEHPLSGHYDISHGRGLALIWPRWLRYVSRENPDKIIQLGERVFGLDLESHHPFEAAERAIEALEYWLEDIGELHYMDSVGIPNDPAMFEKMADDAIRMYGDENGTIKGIKPLTRNDVVEIYKMCLRSGAEEVDSSDQAADESEDQEAAAVDMVQEND
jgi:alcohol dehydrogenase YqhD (iron-dependent ADH family)